MLVKEVHVSGLSKSNTMFEKVVRNRGLFVTICPVLARRKISNLEAASPGVNRLILVNNRSRIVVW